MDIEEMFSGVIERSWSRVGGAGGGDGRVD